MTQEEFDANLAVIMAKEYDRWEQFRLAWDLSMLGGTGIVEYDIETNTLSAV